MIVGDQKPIKEIRESIGERSIVLVLGCRGCVTVCSAGGEKEVAVLASHLRIADKTGNVERTIEELTIERQCDREFIEPVLDKVRQSDVVLSMACGAGVQYVAEVAGDVHVVPALNTRFIGANLEQGVWAERCQACGDCVLEMTGGICPIARCSKSLLNGPCGGSSGGKCEINPEIDCAWQLIHDRLKALGQLDRMRKVLPARNWSTSRDGGPRRRVVEALKK